MAKTKTIITYGLFAMSLLVFGFYSTTMNMAYALSNTQIITAYHDLRGSTYDVETNKWFFGSPVNNTIIGLTDNTTTISATPVGGTCTNVFNVLALGDLQNTYLANYCETGVAATNSIEIRLASTPSIRVDSETGFTNTDEISDMIQWEEGQKLYTTNAGGTTQNIAIFDLTKINSTTTNMFVGTIDTTATFNLIHEGVIVDDLDEMWMIGTDGAGTNGRIGIFCLQISSMCGTIAYGGVSGGIGSIDYNSETGKIFAVGTTANSLITIDAETQVTDATQATICTTGAPIRLTVNENTNQVYILCYVSGTGATNIVLYDVPTSTKVTTFTTPTGSSGTQGGTSRQMSMHWEDTKSALYMSLGWLGTAGSGGFTLTRIQDTTDAPTEDTGGNQVDGRCGVGTALDCVGDRSTLNQITGGTSWATLGNSLFGGIGLVNTTASTDVKENGTGLLLMLMTGAFFSSITIGSIAVANNKFGAGISYTEIPKEFWLFLVVGVISLAYYLQWIPDIVFYSMIVGLAGLFSFGLYKHIRGG